ncbi:sensor histidine kinase [Gemmata massiliana]|nr:ATP-binding protein [Gemmata massiliana]
MQPVTLAVVLVATVFVIDLCLPLGVASAVPYTFAVLLALRAKSGWVGPTVAVLCGVLTFVKMGIVPERGNTEMWKVIANRCLALFAIGMTTLLGLLRRRAEAQVRQHESDLARMSRLAVAGELATVLAHELNQPLAAVCLQADMAALLATESTSAGLRAALGEVAEQSHRAAEIVRSIRRTVRRTDTERGPVDLNEAVRVVARLLEWRARRTGVSVELNLAPEPLPPTYGDRVQLEQVLFNLLQNAIEAVETVHGPRVIVMETAPVGVWLTAHVRDSGPGLADPERVFEQFYTTKPEGMGLGLAISRSIVTAHGGVLTAVARPEGGAEFTCILPIYREEKG